MTNSATRVQTRGLIDPGFVRWLQRGPHEGVVTDDGTIALDDHDSDALVLPDDADIEPGTRVAVRIRQGNVTCKPLDQRDAERDRQRADRERKRAERAREQNEAREDAREFWRQYQIPFDHDVAIKGRRAGLLEGSDGTGTTSQTVTHLFVQEAFEDGRLARDADTYLCDNEANYRFTDGERRTDADGTKYVPEVTCKTCLKRMARWKVPTEE